MILALKTDSPTVEIIILDSEGRVIKRQEWLAERRLALELLGKLESILNECDATWSTLTGLIVYQGPGSFTGLRISITVMNTIAYSESTPIVGVQGETWLDSGYTRLIAHKNDQIVLPEYGAPARITQPRK